MSEYYWATGATTPTNCAKATSTVVSHPPLLHGRFHGLPHWEVWMIEPSNEPPKAAAKCRFLVRRRKGCVLQKQLMIHLFNWNHYAEESRKRTEREWCLGMRKRNRTNSLYGFYSSFWKRTTGQGEPCWERACLCVTTGDLPYLPEWQNEDSGMCSCVESLWV